MRGNSLVRARDGARAHGDECLSLVGLLTVERADVTAQVAPLSRSSRPGHANSLGRDRRIGRNKLAVSLGPDAFATRERRRARRSESNLFQSNC